MAIRYLVPEGKHLPVSGEDGKPDHRLMGAAWAALHSGYRGNKYEGPGKAEAISKLRALYKSEGMETPGEGEAKASEVRDGLVRIAVAYTSPPGRKFEQAGKKFTISESDLAEMGSNLDGREAPIDYEHNMGVAVAPPGFLKAAGWMGGPGRPSALEDFTLRDGSQVKSLWCWARFTPAMAAMLKQQEYRYFSPWFKWNDENEYGEGVGTRLKAGAMTNTPFLQDLPPIEISDTDYNSLFGLDSSAPGGRGNDGQLKLAAVALSEHGAQLIDAQAASAPALLAADSAASGGTIQGGCMKLTIKRGADGTHEVHGPDGKIGELDHDEMMRYAKAQLGLGEPDGDGKARQAKDAGIAEGRTALLKEIGGEGKTALELKALLNPPKSESAFLSETVGENGLIDRAKLDQLADSGQVKPSAMRRALEAEARVERAFKAGRVLPGNEAAALKLSISDPAAFETFIEQGGPAVDLEIRGAIPATGAGGPDGDGPASVALKAAIEKRRRESNESFAVAELNLIRTKEGLNLHEAARKERLAKEQARK